MRITESRLRSIIRSVILESNSEFEYTLQGKFDDHLVDHDDLIGFLTIYDIPENLYTKLEADPNFLNAVMKAGNFESSSSTFVAAYEAYMDGRDNYDFDSWVDEFVKIARNIQQ